MAVRTHKHVSVMMYDGAGSPIDVPLSPGPGDFTHSEIQAGNVDALPIMNRGTFLELVEGPEVPVNWSISLFDNAKVIDGSVDTPANFIQKLGTAASATTTDPGGLVHATKVIVTVTRNGTTSTCTLKNNRCKFSYTEAADGNKLSITGTAYGSGSGDACVWS